MPCRAVSGMRWPARQALGSVRAHDVRHGSMQGEGACKSGAFTLLRRFKEVGKSRILKRDVSVLTEWILSSGEGVCCQLAGCLAGMAVLIEAPTHSPAAI